MQKAKRKPVQVVKKPLLYGNWYGKEAFRLGRRLIPSMLVVVFLYFILSLMLNFDALWLRIASSVLVVLAGFYYLYSNGIQRGESDAAVAEITYERRQEGRPMTKDEEENGYHPLKGFFAAFLGVSPLLLIALVFAFLAKPTLYTVGGLPSWIEAFMRQTEFGDALRYYQTQGGLSAFAVFRIVARAICMPFISVGTALGAEAELWAERLSPLWVLVAPLGYGVGYYRGEEMRARIHTGIAASARKRKRQQRRERRERTRKEPEQLI